MKDSDPDRDAENLFSSRDPEFRRIFGEQWRNPENLDMACMTKREEEEFLLHYGPGKERKALKKRRKAEGHAENTKKRLFRR